MNQKWTTPELIVLVRNTPIESILSYCKMDIGAASGPDMDNTHCQNPFCMFSCDTVNDS